MVLINIFTRIDVVNGLAARKFMIRKREALATHKTWINYSPTVNFDLEMDRKKTVRSNKH